MLDVPDLFIPGETCWRSGTAPRAAFLVDTAAYFKAFVAAASLAETCLYIAGWDFDSRLVLLREGGQDLTFGTFLNRLAAAKPGLGVHVLAWDFAMLYTLERELPLFNLSWNHHRRMHYVLDNAHPLGASQHQKFVVVDDRLAFAGGIDLTKNRWDTPAHVPDDDRRTTPDGTAYGPFHDVQMALAGPLAGNLGELFRQRWLWATGQELPPPVSRKDEPWPGELRVDLNDASMAVSRTFPSYKDRPAVREVEAMTLAVIAAAKRSLYIENQYFTSRKLAGALAARLEEPDGPEVVVVLPEASSGWLEQSTMDSLRRHVLAELLAHDRHGRLRLLTPLTDDGTPIYVHSKLMVADDRLAMVGSANLTNRSMGFDSELVLTVDAATAPKTAQAVAGLRHRLLAEHLGCEVAEVSKAIEESGSLITAISGLRRKGRCLVHVVVDREPPLDTLALVADENLIDPERPMALDRAIDLFAREEPRNRHRALFKALGALAMLLGLAAVWRFTPLSEQIDIDRLAGFGAALRGNPLALAVVPLVFVLAGLAMIPVVALIGATAIVFDPLWALVLGLVGCLASASVGYALGAVLGRETIRRLAGRRLNRLSRQLARKGFLAVAVLRNVPVAPYTLVNLVAGASHLSFAHFIVGTAIGMAPGVTIMTIFAGRIESLIKNPDPVNIAITLAVIAVVAVGALWLGRRLTRYGKSS